MGNIDEKYLPNAIVVGAPKCGTTWLYDNLVVHPEILIPRKEIHYFSNNYSKGHKWFINHFKEKYSGEKILMDLATNYIYDKDYYNINFEYIRDIAKEIKDLIKNPKLIFIFRDPVKRAFSEYINLLQGVIRYGLMYKGDFKRLNVADAKELGFRHFEQYENFQAQLDAYYVPDSFEKSIVTTPNHLARGFYDIYVKNYLDYFDRESILFLEFEMIKNDPEGLLKTIYNFLDIEEYYDSAIIYKKSNYAEKRPLPKNWRLQSKLNFTLRKKNRSALSKALINTISSFNNSGKKPKMKDGTAQMLARWFKPHNLELQRMTGLDLSHWT